MKSLDAKIGQLTLENDFLESALGKVGLLITRQIDELHLEHPFMGALILRDQLNRAGHDVGRRDVGMLMKRIGIGGTVLKAGHEQEISHKVYHYQLRGLTINRANQVLALDTTYIPMAKGFVYLVAVLDRASRKVLAAKVVITLESCYAVDVLQDAFNRYGTPDIVNTFSLPLKNS